MGTSMSISFLLVRTLWQETIRMLKTVLLLLPSSANGWRCALIVSLSAAVAGCGGGGSSGSGGARITPAQPTYQNTAIYTAPASANATHEIPGLARIRAALADPLEPRYTLDSTASKLVSIEPAQLSQFGQNLATDMNKQIKSVYQLRGAVASLGGELQSNFGAEYRANFNYHRSWRGVYRTLRNAAAGSVISLPYTSGNHAQLNALATSKDLLVILPTGNGGGISANQQQLLGRTIFVTGIAPTSDCDPTNISSCFESDSRANACGAFFQSHCLGVWYDSGLNISSLTSDGSTTSHDVAGTEFGALIVASLADAVLGIWPTLSNENLKQLLLNCASDLGTAGVDATYGHGMLSTACLFEASGLLYNNNVQELQNQALLNGAYDSSAYAGSAYLSDISLGKIPGTSTILRAAGLYARAYSSTSTLQVAHDGTIRSVLSDIGLVSTIREPNFATITNDTAAINTWLDGLPSGSIAYIPFTNANTATALATAAAKNLLLIFPAEASADNVSSSTADQLFLDNDSNTDNPSTFNNVIIVGSAKYSAAQANCPTVEPSNVADVVHCFTKDSISTTVEGTDDCGKIFQEVCITGLYNLERLLDSSDGPVLDTASGTRHAALQIAAALDSVRALWPSLDTASELRELLFHCAHSAGIPSPIGFSERWGRGLVSLDCLIASDGSLLSNPPTPLPPTPISAENTSIYALSTDNAPHQIPGILRLQRQVPSLTDTSTTRTTVIAELQDTGDSISQIVDFYTLPFRTVPSDRKRFPANSSIGKLQHNLNSIRDYASDSSSILAAKMATITDNYDTNYSIRVLANSKDLLLILPAGDYNNGRSDNDEAAQDSDNLTRSIIVSGISPTNDCDLTDLSTCFTSAQGLTRACGIDYQNHCIGTWYQPGHTGVNGSSPLVGTNYSAAIVAAATDNLLAAWPSMSILRAKHLLLACAEDLGAPGTDEIYGRGVLSLGCLYESHQYALLDTSSSQQPFWQAAVTHGIPGMRRAHSLFNHGFISTINPTNQLAVATTSSLEAALINVAAFNALPSRLPSYTTVAAVGDAAAWLDGLPDSAPTTRVAFLPHENANTASVMQAAQNNNILLIVPASTSSSAIGAAGARQLATDSDSATENPSDFNNLLVVGSAHRYSTLVSGSDNAKIATRDSSGTNLLPGCPLGAQADPTHSSDFAKCYVKKADPANTYQLNFAYADDCGETFKNVCITGNAVVTKLHATLLPYLDILATTADLVYPTGTYEQGSVYAALQLATAADTLLGLWPTQFDTATKLRNFIASCALDAGDTGVDSIWGQGIASLSCLFRPSGLLYDSNIIPDGWDYNLSGQTPPYWQGLITHGVPGFRRFNSSTNHRRSESIGENSSLAIAFGAYVSEQTARDVAQYHSVVNRNHSYTNVYGYSVTVTGGVTSYTRGSGDNWLSGLGQSATSVALLPLMYANTDDVMRVAQRDNILVVMPAATSALQVSRDHDADASTPEVLQSEGATTAQLHTAATPTEPSTEQIPRPASLDNLLIVGSAFLYGPTVLGADSATVATRDGSGGNLLANCPLGDQTDPASFSDFANCYVKVKDTTLVGNPNHPLVHDCGDAFKDICITGSILVTTSHATLVPSLDSTTTANLTYPNGTYEEGATFAALQLAIAADAVLARWPTQFATANDLRDLIISCALDAGDPGSDAVWGQGIAALGFGCLFEPAGLLYDANTMADAVNQDGEPLWSTLAGFGLPGQAQMRTAIINKASVYTQRNSRLAIATTSTLETALKRTAAFHSIRMPDYNLLSITDVSTAAAVNTVNAWLNSQKAPVMVNPAVYETSVALLPFENANAEGVLANARDKNILLIVPASTNTGGGSPGVSAAAQLTSDTDDSSFNPDNFSNLLVVGSAFLYGSPSPGSGSSTVATRDGSGTNLLTNCPLGNQADPTSASDFANCYVKTDTSGNNLEFADDCGAAFQYICVTGNAVVTKQHASLTPSLNTSATTADLVYPDNTYERGSLFAAVQLATAADALLARWPTQLSTAARLRNLITSCALDAGTFGVDSVWGQGIASFGCLFQPSGQLYDDSIYTNNFHYANEQFWQGLPTHGLPGFAKLHNAISQGLTKPHSTNSRLVIATIDDAGGTVLQAELQNLTTFHTLSNRSPSYNRITSLSDAPGWLNSLKNQNATTVALLPYENANHADTMEATQNNNVLLIVPASASSGSTGVAAAVQLTTDTDISTNNPVNFDNLLVVGSAALYGPLVPGTGSSTVATRNASEINLLTGCPLGNQADPANVATSSDPGDLFSGFSNCYVKTGGGGTNISFADDCGDAFKDVCVTGSAVVTKTHASLTPSLDTAAVTADLVYPDGTYEQGSLYAAAQLASVADTVLALWPTQFDTADKLRSLILDCALDAGATGTDSIWGQGIASLGCLFQPSGALYDTHIYASEYNYTDEPFWQGMDTHWLPGLSKLRDAVGYSATTISHSSRLSIATTSALETTIKDISQFHSIRTPRYEQLNITSVVSASDVTAITDWLGTQTTETSVAFLPFENANTANVLAAAKARDILLIVPAIVHNGTDGATAASQLTVDADDATTNPASLDNLLIVGSAFLYAPPSTSGQVDVMNSSGNALLPNCPIGNRADPGNLADFSECYVKLSGGVNRLYADDCGDAFKDACITGSAVVTKLNAQIETPFLKANGEGWSGLSAAVNYEQGSLYTALQVAVVADALLALWPAQLNSASTLRDLITGCALDGPGTSGVDSAWGHGVASLLCLFNPSGNVLYDTLPSALAPAPTSQQTAAPSNAPTTKTTTPSAVVTPQRAGLPIEGSLTLIGADLPDTAGVLGYDLLGRDFFYDVGQGYSSIDAPFVGGFRQAIFSALESPESTAIPITPAVTEAAVTPHAYSILEEGIAIKTGQGYLFAQRGLRQELESSGTYTRSAIGWMQPIRTHTLITIALGHEEKAFFSGYGNGRFAVGDSNSIHLGLAHRHEFSSSWAATGGLIISAARMRTPDQSRLLHALEGRRTNVDMALTYTPFEHLAVSLSGQYNSGIDGEVVIGKTRNRSELMPLDNSQWAIRWDYKR